MKANNDPNLPGPSFQNFFQGIYEKIPFGPKAGEGKPTKEAVSQVALAKFNEILNSVSSLINNLSDKLKRIMKNDPDSKPVRITINDVNDISLEPCKKFIENKSNFKIIVDKDDDVGNLNYGLVNLANSTETFSYINRIGKEINISNRGLIGAQGSLVSIGIDIDGKFYIGLPPSGRIINCPELLVNNKKISKENRREILEIGTPYTIRIGDKTYQFTIENKPKT